MDGFKFLLGLGVSLSWIGFVPFNFSRTSTSAIYSIDNQTPISFSVPALSTADVRQLYNQVFFTTETLSPEQHELIVTYQGNSGTAPLALDNFVVQNASATSALTSVPGATSATSSSVPTSTSSNSTSNLGSKKSPLAGIIVGVVGGVIVLVLLVLLLLYIGKRNNRRTQKLNTVTTPEPFRVNQNYTSEVPFLIPQSFPSKFSRRREPDNAPGSSRPTSTPPPVIGAQIDLINPAIRNSEMIPLIQPSTFAEREGGDLVLQHADSGVRMWHDQGILVELPPAYTT